MLSRRGFFRGALGWFAAVRLDWTSKRTSVQAVPSRAQEWDRPEESVQDLIQQVHLLMSEQHQGYRKHIRAIEDQIRVRLLLAGMACIYADEYGHRHVCALEARTGALLTLPVRLSSLPWARRAWTEIGLDGLEDRLNEIPHARDI
jgi:hypothetical protein